MKPSLLFLCHRLPVPPNKGDKIRSFNILKHLSKSYTVYLAGFIDDEDDAPYIDDLSEYCEEYYIVKKSKLGSLITGASGFLTQSPISIPYYYSGKIKRWVERISAEKNIQRVFVYSAAVAQYALGLANAKGSSSPRILMDFVDVDSDKWRQYASQKSGLAKWFYAREARLLEAYEVKVFNAVSASVFVSKQEADFFNERLLEHAPLAKQAYPINNGVDADYFNPRLVNVESIAMSDNAVVFTGAMDYWPNVEAVVWFAKEVWPQVLEHCANAQFYIVGSKPSDEVSALAMQPGITVTGRVEDVRPYIAKSSLVIAPLQIARGIQNKVLEGMAMAKPIVLTKLAGEGISTESMPAYYICEDANTYVNMVVELLNNPKIQAEQNRVFIQRYFDWDTELVRLKGYLE